MLKILMTLENQWMGLFFILKKNGYKTSSESVERRRLAHAGFVTLAAFELGYDAAAVENELK